MALLALPNGACEQIRWTFTSGGRAVAWDVVGVAREAVGTFSRSKVLEVRITNEPDPAPSPRTENVMVQSYRVRGIGRAFLVDAAPRLQVFWAVDRTAAVTTRRGDLLALASSQPPLFGGALTHLGVKKSVGPEPGVYVRGIWVRKPPRRGGANWGIPNSTPTCARVHTGAQAARRGRAHGVRRLCRSDGPRP